MAYDLVLSGFIGETDGIGTVFGSVVADRFEPAVMVEELGARWEIARNYFKRHAACRYAHGALDALVDIVSREGGALDPASVKVIEVDTYVWAAQLDSPEPKNMLAAKFSLPFALATAIVTGAASVPAFRDRARADARTRGLAGRVVVREDPSLTAMLPGLRPARLRLHLNDGRTLSAEVLTNRGDTEDPYSADEVREKFRELAEPVWGTEHASLILGVVETLEGRGVDELCRLLARSPQQETPP
jgi:2-methylcitrate dehydratase PrpD